MISRIQFSVRLKSERLWQYLSSSSLVFINRISQKHVLINFNNESCFIIQFSTVAHQNPEEHTGGTPNRKKGIKQNTSIAVSHDIQAKKRVIMGQLDEERDPLI